MKRDLKQTVLETVNELVAAVSRLVSSVGSHVGEAASSVGDAAGSVLRKTSKDAGTRGEKLASSIKAHWASMTPKQRAARVKKMLAGRGLKPKPKKRGRPSAKSIALGKALKSHWANMPPAARKARVKRMLAGRGLKPKS